ncbi:TPA: gfo/Idh/MocA family oxidoreductase [Patescibacteria group bacterium]|nr:MAG: hypothetical protein UV51_C0013G0005 [Candidatus Woesebacteria bacterium GW2011_GWC1_42_9]HCI05313.1 gfo/Idh/MocA family oxidoreductase [Patescibacteria group bacterium]
MKTINFAVLGCGKIGTRHAEKLNGTDYVKLVAVCDIVPERALALSEKYVCRPYFGMDDLLKDPSVDFVNICTPSGLHAEHTIRCLNAGKNVLCEKPMALTLKDAKRMVETAKANNKLLYVVQQNRYNPPVKLAKQLIKERKMGEPIMCIVNMLWNRDDEYYKNDSWRGTLALDGGTIYTQASHFIDLMLMFMGKPKSLYSLMGTKNHSIEIEDTGVISVEFKNGSFGSVSYTTCATKKNFEGSVTLVFSRGTIKIGGEYLNTIDYFSVDGFDSYQLEETDSLANDYGTYRGSMSNHDKIFKDIIEKQNNPDKPTNLVFDEDAFQTIEFIETALNSARTGKVVIF